MYKINKMTRTTVINSRKKINITFTGMKKGTG